jgi:2-oxoglutarate dehydrogenase complex dehydrogenase (E1) component-like enzyme
MGGWTFVAPRLTENLERPIRYAGRRSAASPAAGSLAKHKHEQKKLLKAAFNLTDK